MAEGRGPPERGEPVCIVKDMAITHADFFRTLRPLLEDGRHELSRHGAKILLDGGHIELRLGPQGTRALGNFRLPRTRVELCFEGCSQQAVEDFIARFDLRFRRGGG